MRKSSIAALAVVIMSTVAGCSSATVATSSPTPTPSQTQATSPTPTPAATGTPAPTPSTSSPSTGGSSVVADPAPLVSRPGGLPAADRIKAAAVTYHQAVVYKDGLDVKVTAIKQQKITAQGPGALTGKPSTTFTINFTNNTDKAINLNQVVVSAYYGKPAQAAQPVYDNDQNDFAGVLAPGKSAATAYTFSIPVADLTSVTLTVDFDGVHTAAVFAGAAVS